MILILVDLLLALRMPKIGGSHHTSHRDRAP
jgi:hypothetical protein